jgi:drug/metabolite transporter (DMT)-like permease
MNAAAENKAPLWLIILSFAAVYIIWGSTYLAIRFAIETIPPLLMVGTRFVFGGALFLIWTALSGAPAARAIHWKSGAISGVLMIAGGTGAVTLAEQWVPSGVTALMIAAVPFFIVLLDWLRPGGLRPHVVTVLALIVGFIGLFLLIKPIDSAAEFIVDPIGAIFLIVGSLSWAIGSLYSRYGTFPDSHSQSLGMKMLLGGVALLIIGTISGEWSQLDPAAISSLSFLSLLYQIIFGSAAFGAYVYLLKYSTPAKAATYAYVNPVVAMILGVWIGGELFSTSMILPMAIIIIAVIMITSIRKRRQELMAAEESEEDPIETETEIDAPKHFKLGLNGSNEAGK